MRQKPARPLLLLLDADVVIEAHRLGVWEVLIARSGVACPATVVHDEALFYCKEEHSVPASIHLPRLAADGQIAMLEGTAGDLRRLDATLTPDVLGRLHLERAKRWPFCWCRRHRAISSVLVIGQRSTPLLSWGCPSGGSPLSAPSTHLA